MNKELVSAELAHLAATPGVRLCALVDSQTGMVWLSEGHKDGMEALLEAARDYWRVHMRHGTAFRALGPALGVTVRHEAAVLNLSPCGPELVLVTLADPGRINMRGWPGRLELLRSLLRALLR
jgi:hypothetical protein